MGIANARRNIAAIGYFAAYGPLDFRPQGLVRIWPLSRRSWGQQGMMNKLFSVIAVIIFASFALLVVAMIILAVVLHV
jgi:hypothetical protein